MVVIIVDVIIVVMVVVFSVFYMYEVGVVLNGSIAMVNNVATM